MGSGQSTSTSGTKGGTVIVKSRETPFDSYDQFAILRTKMTIDVVILLKPLQDTETNNEGLMFMASIAQRMHRPLNPAGLVGSLLFPGVPEPLDPITSKYFKHSAIVVDGEFYEYSVDGLGKAAKGSKADSMLRRFNEKYNERSSKTLSRFREWIDDQEQFTKSTYNAGYNNCHHFVEAACKFLGISVPEAVQCILNACKVAGPLIGIAGCVSNSSKSSSSSSSDSSCVLQ